MTNSVLWFEHNMHLA